MSLSPTATDGIALPAAFVRDRLIRLSQVMDIVGLGKTSIYELIKTGAFPAPCKPGGSASRWSENAALAWIHECKAQTVH